MLHNNIVYSIACIVLCASVAFAAQEPLTPEVANDNMLVTPDGGKATTPQKSADTVVKKPEVPAVNVSYKPTLPAKSEKSEPKPPALPAGPVSIPNPDTTSTKQEEKGLTVPVPPLTPTVGQITFLRGQLEEKKLQVAIAEQEARLRQINAPSPAPVPVMQAMPLPQIPLDMLLDSQKIKPAKSPTFASPDRRQKGVVSIQGVNGVLSATIATAKGTVTVKQGDSFGGGKVESISYNQVMVRAGKKTAPIPFVE